MERRIDDIRIQATRPLLPPAILVEELPRTPSATELVWDSRETIRRILLGEDKRLVVVVGPCSIHDIAAALDYATRLKLLAERYHKELFVVMRSYFEKPRTTVGWKGIINDPDLDESYKINKGLRMARGLLCDLAELGLPAGTEFLDTTVPQHIADLISWGAIGARTTESQTHRELASGLSMPIGFKNGTDGRIETAIESVQAAGSSHWFASTTKDGVAAISHSTGNDCCHIILRGGSKTGPNYSATHVVAAAERLQRANLAPRVMIDFSHGNSQKDHLRQRIVAEDVAKQVQGGSQHIMGVMIESNLVAGRQNARPGCDLVYGQSITDACVSFEETEPILEMLARAVRA